MSSIIPVDLLAFATNVNYLSSLVTTNISNPSVISLLSYHDDFINVIGENATARQLYNLDWQAFHEAGVYNKHTNKLYVTSNWAGDINNPINVTVIDMANNYSLSSTRYDGLAEPNGGTSYFPPGTQTPGSTPPHILYCDEGDFDHPSALISIDPLTGASTPLLTNFLGRTFSSLNDVRQHPVTGDLWFTDADYGHFQHFRPAPTLPKHVYRFSPATGALAVVAAGFAQPNGLEFSPDAKTLYVTDTGAVGFDVDATRPATIYAFDVVEQRVLARRRTFAFVDSGVPDGIHTDVRGNVWAGCGDGVHVWNEGGALLGKVWVGVECNNFAFVPGGLLVFTNEQLWVVEGVGAVGREVARDWGV